MEKIVGINQRAKEYIYGRYNGVKMPMHRVIWLEHHGEIPTDHMIHHINEDKKDNRIENLMCLTRKEHGSVHRKLSSSPTNSVAFFS